MKKWRNIEWERNLMKSCISGSFWQKNKTTTVFLSFVPNNKENLKGRRKRSETKFVGDNNTASLEQIWKLFLTMKKKRALKQVHFKIIVN